MFQIQSVLLNLFNSFPLFVSRTIIKHTSWFNKFRILLVNRRSSSSRVKNSIIKSENSHLRKINIFYMIVSPLRTIITLLRRMFEWREILNISVKFLIFIPFVYYIKRIPINYILILTFSR